MFEADVILETTHSAIAQLERLQNELSEMEDLEGGNYEMLDSGLSAVQIGAIRRVYNYNGIDKEVIKVLLMRWFHVVIEDEPEGLHPARVGASASEGE